MSPEPAASTWFPDGKVDLSRVANLSSILMQMAREAGFSRNTFAVAVGQLAESLCGVDLPDFDPEVQRFVGERLVAAGTALKGADN